MDRIAELYLLAVARAWEERSVKPHFISGTRLMGDQAVKASYDSFMDSLEEEKAKKAQGKPDFVAIGTNIGELVKKKNEAYGDSFAKAAKILEILFPDGVPVSQYTDMLGLIRVIDKQFRIANRKDAFGESPWGDIAGYGVLGVANDEQCKSTKKGA